MDSLIEGITLQQLQWPSTVLGFGDTNKLKPPLPPTKKNMWSSDVAEEADTK